MNGVMQLYLDFKTRIFEWLDRLSDIQLMIWVVVLTALIFLVMHGQRDKILLKNISIISGLIPVLIHELGHALAAKITGGKVRDIHMVLTHRGQTKKGAQGYAETVPRGRISAIVIAFMGYVFPPLMLFLGVYLITHQYSFVYVLILIFLSFFYLVHTRQLYLPLLFIVILLYTGYDLSITRIEITNGILDIVFNVILGLLLGETIQSIIITAKTVFSQSHQEWDGSLLQRLTLIPGFIWFLIWMILSLGFIYYSFLMII